MDSPKPKKALRHLFTKTEPTLEEEKTPNELVNSNREQTPPLKDETIEVKAFDSVSVASQLQNNLNFDDKEEQQKQAQAINNDSQAFAKSQHSLDLSSTERNKWHEQDYISFINRIDQAQTDVFFLKGKLVAEVKDKFYTNNKKGWALFCVETLNMNYTTANQYIRVAQEFDVTSHQRRDFGFEHFKALLPLSKEARDEVLVQTPHNVSVKSLRDIVTKKLYNNSLGAGHDSHVSSKSVVETLQKLKIQLSKLRNVTLNQEEKWQLYGAFQNLSEEMRTISTTFVSNSEIKSEVSHITLQHN